MTKSPLGRFSKHVLLTGAGWSRNWGAPLAIDVRQFLLGHPLVQHNAKLRELLLAEPSFEIALGRTHHTPYSDSDRRELERALLDTFISMDREIARPDHDPWIPIYDVQKFLFRFWGQTGDAFDTGYLFTLNQDLFFERYLFNEHVSGAPAGSLPGIEVKPNLRFFHSDIGAYSEEFDTRPTATPEIKYLPGNMNVVKLHGSFNWRTADGRNVLVMGTAKTRQIAKLPLLAWYAEVFQEVLASGDVRLMTIGYGFRDEHINATIASAINHHRLKVFIWNADDNLEQNLRSALDGKTIWNAQISHSTCTMTEVFPPNQSETEEFRRIRYSFFGS